MTDQPYDIDKLVADAEAAFNAVRSGATGRFGYSWVFIRDHGEAIIALARDYKAALDATRWQPIETAICDDRFALVYWQDGNMQACLLDHDSDPAWWRERGATHWMPLPAPPEDE